MPEEQKPKRAPRNPKGHPATLIPGANKKGNPSSLVPGAGAAKPGEIRRPQWEGLDEEAWETFLGRISAGENASRIVTSELDIAYCTFTAWRRRTGKEEEFHEALRARVEAMQFEIMDIADDQEADVYIDGDGKECTNHNIIQRSKIRIDTRLAVMRSLDTRFRPKSEVDVTSKGEQVGAMMDEDAIIIAAEVIQRKRAESA